MFYGLHPLPTLPVTRGPVPWYARRQLSPRCVRDMQGNGGGLYGDTNSNIIVQHSNFSFNNAAVRALTSDTEKPLAPACRAVAEPRGACVGPAG